MLKPRPAGEPFDGHREVAGSPSPPGTYGILDFARLPMAILEDATHIVRYANPALCRLLGKSKEEMMGNAFAESLPQGDECLVLLDRVYRTGKTESHTERDDAGAPPHPLYWSYDIWPVRAGPSAQDLLSGVMIQVTETAPLHRQASAMNEALLVSAVRQHELMEAAEMLNTKLQAEMKERKQIQEALLQSELLANAGRMAASIAHEINNPLAAVMNSLFLVRTTPGLPLPALEYLDIADGELLRIAHIARQTLGFYREFSIATSNSVSALMGSVVNLLQAKIRATQATVVQQCDEGLQVMGVAGELRQVLANLLANSLDAIQQSGVVKVRCSPLRSPHTGSRRIRITVADNGMGIEATAMKQIFEPFFTTKGKIGTGLGLWVCKQLVEKTGGSIRVRSRTDGEPRGTTFSITLPSEAAIPAASVE